MPRQVYNTEMSSLLASSFVKSRNPWFSWGRAASAFKYLPGLRGLWLHSAFDNNGDLPDDSGNGLLMAATKGSTGQSENLVTFTSYTAASGEYHSFAHTADVGFTTSFTVGGWFRFDSLAAVNPCVTKYAASGQRRWALYCLASPAAVFAISTNGTTVTQSVTSTATIVVDTWYFIVGRYATSTSVDIYVDNVKTSNTTSIPSAMYNGDTAPVRIGDLNGTYLNGDASLTFLCARALDDHWITALYEATRHLFK